MIKIIVLQVIMNRTMPFRWEEAIHFSRLLKQSLEEEIVELFKGRWDF